MSKDFTVTGTNRTFTAEHFAEPRNHCLVPVVDGETLAELVAARPGTELAWDGDGDYLLGMGLSRSEVD